MMYVETANDEHENLYIKNKNAIETILFYDVFYNLAALENERRKLLNDIKTHFENMENAETSVDLSQKLLVLETKIKTLQRLKNAIEEHVEITL